MSGKFHTHMEFGQHQETIEVMDVFGDQILQVVYQRDRLRAEAKQSFSYTIQHFLSHSYVVCFAIRSPPPL